MGIHLNIHHMYKYKTQKEHENELFMFLNFGFRIVILTLNNSNPEYADVWSLSSLGNAKTKKGHTCATFFYTITYY